MSIEAMKLAMETLEEIADEMFSPYDNKLGNAILALRAAIEQAQPEQDGTCSHCDGVGCVACDARHLPEQEPVAGKPLPCPFCGASDGLTMTDGSTYRWGYAYCSNCGASAGETRREYPDDGKWYQEAIQQWNQRTTPPRREWQGLTDDEKRLFSSWLDEKSDDAVFRAIEAKLREKNT